MESDEDKWIKHYSSFHRILLVGEGDFSFSLCLALAFGSATNIVASSLDSYEELITKYKNAKSNLILLKYMGASIFHEVDATKMKHHYGLVKRKFDRIIYNFPHAGFHGKEDKPNVIMKHRNLVSEFFRNACGLLQENGEIHVSHKTTYPFNNWKIEDLASKHSLKLIECADFNIEDYPGYKNKKGAGPNCDSPFPLRECCTFKFILCIPEAKRVPKVQLQNAASFDRRLPSFPVTFVNDMTLHAGLRVHLHLRNECIKIFGGYLDHVEQTFGRTDYDVYGPLNDALRLGFEKFTHEIPARPFDDYTDILEELHHMSTLRSQKLKDMLSAIELVL